MDTPLRPSRNSNTKRRYSTLQSYFGIQGKPVQTRVAAHYGLRIRPAKQEIPSASLRMTKLCAGQSAPLPGPEA